MMCGDWCIVVESSSPPHKWRVSGKSSNLFELTLLMLTRLSKDVKFEGVFSMDIWNLTRLEVSFQQTFENNEYILKENMISFICKENKIILDYSGHVGFHIDIFIQSQDPNQHEIHEILATHILKHHFQECAHLTRGCPWWFLKIVLYNLLVWKIWTYANKG